MRIGLRQGFIFIPDINTMRAQEILPNIWLGDIASATSVSFCRKRQIRLCCNCCNSSTTHHSNISTFHLPQDLTAEGLLETTRRLAISYKTLTPTLIYCETGNQASATLVAAFLIRYTGMEWESAIRILQTKRPEAFRPTIWGLDYIKQMEEACCRENVEEL